jgi:hypothetical protein
MSAAEDEEALGAFGVELLLQTRGKARERGRHGTGSSLAPKQRRKGKETRLGRVGRKKEGAWASSAWGSRSIVRGRGGPGERHMTGLQRCNRCRFSAWKAREQGKEGG